MKTQTSVKQKGQKRSEIVSLCTRLNSKSLCITGLQWNPEEEEITNEAALRR